jgi:hypothetical protein
MIKLLSGGVDDTGQLEGASVEAKNRPVSTLNFNAASVIGEENQSDEPDRTTFRAF